MFARCRTCPTGIMTRHQFDAEGRMGPTSINTAERIIMAQIAGLAKEEGCGLPNPFSSAPSLIAAGAEESTSGRNAGAVVGFARNLVGPLPRNWLRGLCGARRKEDGCRHCSLSHGTIHAIRPRHRAIGFVTPQRGELEHATTTAASLVTSRTGMVGDTSEPLLPYIAIGPEVSG